MANARPQKNLKYAIFVASPKALKLCNDYCDPLSSYCELHKLSNRATPAIYSNFKCVLLLHKMFIGTAWNNEWLHLNYDVNNSSKRQNLWSVDRTTTNVD
jgi:hypothetical protein